MTECSLVCDPKSACYWPSPTIQSAGLYDLLDSRGPVTVLPPAGPTLTSPDSCKASQGPACSQGQSRSVAGAWGSCAGGAGRPLPPSGSQWSSSPARACQDAAVNQRAAARAGMFSQRCSDSHFADEETEVQSEVRVPVWELAEPGLQSQAGEPTITHRAG